MGDHLEHIERLIINYLNNSINKQEQQELNTWKSLSEENQEIFNSYVDSWNISSKCEIFNQINLDKDWDIICKKRSKQITQVSGKKYSLIIRRIAAVLIPALLIVSASYVYWNVPGFGRLTAYQTSSEIMEVSLPDGSIVSLNKNSKIVFSNNIDKSAIRTVSLEGEALFNVNHNRTEFNVNVSDVNIKVMGTEFNVNAKQPEIMVSVLEGKVQVSTPLEHVVLTKGERALVNKSMLKEEFGMTDNDVYWNSKKLRFKQADLKEICNTLKKVFPEIKSIKFSSKDFNIKVTTTFNNQSLEEIIEELKLHFDKKINFKDGTLIVSD